MMTIIGTSVLGVKSKLFNKLFKYLLLGIGIMVIVFSLLSIYHLNITYT